LNKFAAHEDASFGEESFLSLRKGRRRKKKSLPEFRQKICRFCLFGNDAVLKSALDPENLGVNLFGESGQFIVLYTFAKNGKKRSKASSRNIYNFYFDAKIRSAL
jgi:hypothetical protein